MMQVESPAAVFRKIQTIGVIPAIRTADAEAALRSAEAICEGGIPVVEISMAAQGGLDTLRSVVQVMGSSMLVGAGTVLDGETARRAHEAGCRFIVTTGFDLSAVQASKEAGMPVFAGAMTPTEVQVAMRAACDVVKLFPCSAVGGPQYVRTLHAQYPSVNFIASGGVTLENCPEYFHAGACAVGVGGAIADSESMGRGEFRIFKERAKRFRKVSVEAQARWCREKTLQEV
jgi:2-dehydro-3-deoxyphosphogluconate aldolase / (4S)-4-hydroxy-2-oxoglutarate aldolase